MKSQTITLSRSNGMTPEQHAQMLQEIKLCMPGLVADYEKRHGVKVP